HAGVDGSPRTRQRGSARVPHRRRVAGDRGARRNRSLDVGLRRGDDSAHPAARSGPGRVRRRRSARLDREPPPERASLHHVLDEVRAEVAHLASQRADTLTALATATSALDERVRASVQAAGAGDDGSAAAAAADAGELRQERRSLLDDLDVLDQTVRDTIDTLREAGLDPCDAETDVPIALLPLRIETRFSADGAVLRVRAYPDDAHVDRLA